MSVLRDALRAEWTKLRTTPAPGLLAAGLVVLTGGLGAVIVASARYSVGAVQDPAKLSLTGVDLGQALAASLAVVIIGGEYGTGMIRVSLTAVPRRTTLLVAKAIVLTLVTLASGAVAVASSVLTGRLLLPGDGFTAAHGYPSLSLAHGATLRAAAGSVLYLCLVALLALGVTTAMRESTTAMGVVLAILYLFPIIASVVTDPTWQRHLRQIGPMDAGLAVQNTTGLQALPIGPWAGIGVLASWAVGALLLGGLVLRLRDA